MEEIQRKKEGRVIQFGIGGIEETLVQARKAVQGQMLLVRSLREELDLQERILVDKKRERDYLSDINSDPTTGVARNGSDKFLVRREDLAPIILEWIEEWQRDMGANGWRKALGERACVSGKTIKRILRGPTPSEVTTRGATGEWVTLLVADALLTAIGRSNLLGDPVRIHRNPFILRPGQNRR